MRHFFLAQIINNVLMSMFMDATLRQFFSRHDHLNISNAKHTQKTDDLMIHRTGRSSRSRPQVILRIHQSTKTLTPSPMILQPSILFIVDSVSIISLSNLRNSWSRVVETCCIMRSATESIIRAEELERLEDDIAAEDAIQMKPDFPALSAVDAMGGKIEYRRIRCPPRRLTPLRNQWDLIMSPIVEFLRLQIRFNPKTRSVELKTSELTEDPGAIQKGQDFVEAFMMGFEVQDAVALLRLEDLYIDSFMVTDVKMLAGDHLSRAIGRVVGQEGKTRYAIENATKSRIVVADQKIHIMGSFANIKLARDAICNLIIGAPPGKVYNQMRNVAKRMNERF